MADYRKNLANAVVDTMTPSTTATTIPLVAGYGATMPALPFFYTFTPPGQLSTRGNSEIVLVTARSTDTLTVVRAQKGTSAKSIGTGWIGSNAVYVEQTAAVGDIIMTLNASPQTGRLFMAGGTYTKANYPLLYDHVVNNPGYGTYTTTAGSESFTLKDMRQRFPIGVASSGTGSSLGGTGGQIDHRHGAGDSLNGSATNSGFGGGDMRAAIGASASDANRIGYTAHGAIMPDGGTRPNQTYSGTWANASSGRGDWNHFTPVFGYTTQNNPPFIAVNFEVIAG